MIINNFDTEILWEKVREMNEMSHSFSEQADVLTRAIQLMEGKED